MERMVREALESGRMDVVQEVGNGVYAVPAEIVNPYLMTSCAQCGTTLKQCLTCSACGDIRYCGKACQVASWKSIHKLYCKRHKEMSVGKLCWDHLFAAQTFSQVTVTLREHEGLGQLIESAMGQVLLSQKHLVQNAKLSDIKSMARVTSRRLSRKDPSCDQAAGLLTIAAAMSTIATPLVDDALAETPLFKCVARFYWHYAPRLAGCSREGQHETIDIPLLSAMVNLVHPKAPSTKDLMTRCVDATWDTIEACAATLAEKDDNPSAQKADNTEAPPKTEEEPPKTINSNELKHMMDGILPNLRMLARNLAYIGARPSQTVAERMPRIVVADFLYGIRDMDHDAIQVWATTAQNMVEIDEKWPANGRNNEESGPTIAMAPVGNTIFEILQVCAKQKLGGMDIVFRNEQPPPGEQYWNVEERRVEESNPKE